MCACACVRAHHNSADATAQRNARKCDKATYPVIYVQGDGDTAIPTERVKLNVMQKG